MAYNNSGFGHDQDYKRDGLTTKGSDIIKDRISADEKVAEEVQKFKDELALRGIKKGSEEYKRLVKKEQDFQDKLVRQSQHSEDKAFEKKTKERQRKQEIDTKKKIEEEFKLRKAEGEKLSAEDLLVRKNNIKELHKLEREQANIETKKLIGDKLSSTFGSLSAITKLTGTLSKLGDNAMQKVMSTYAQYQSAINVRLQGTANTFQTLQKSLLDNVGITPYLKTQNMLNNLQSLVESGVSFNLEQRAFLMSISDKIAATFDANTGTLRRIIKLQQEDSTAGRLGMEAYMTRFMNSMFENTEYLVENFDSVTDALVEATSQMTTEMGVEFEYVVQKWLGSLSSVGLSSNTVSNIAQAIGYLASGDVSGLESSTMQQLLVMAASRAGLDYGAMLSGGMTTTQTNTLMSSLVAYMQEIASSDNNVVRNQFAKTFGLSMSDLRAAANLNVEDIKNISSSLLSYTGAITELGSQMKQVSSRISLAEMLENVSENAQFSMFSTIASSPALYALWQVTSMIQDFTEGINIPTVGALGTFVHVGTSLNNLLKLGVMGAGSLGMIGDIISGISNTRDFSKALTALGISSEIVGTTRGTGIGSLGGGLTESASNYIGQSGGDAFYEQTMNRQAQENQEKLEQMQEQQGETAIDTINDNVAAIVTLLENGIKVSVDNYGLTSNLG